MLLQGPAGEPVQRGGQVIGRQFHQPVRSGRRQQIGGRHAPVGQPVADPGPGLFAVPDGGGWPFRDDPAAADHRGLVGQVLRLVHVMRGQQDRLAQRGQVLDDLPRLVPRRGIESGRGLVEEQQIRVADQGDRDVQPPLLSAGQLQHPGVPLLLQAHQLDHLVHRPRPRVVPGVHRDGLRYGEVAVHAAGLQDDPDLALQLPPLPGGVVAEDLHRAAVAGPVALEDLDRGGLPGPVRAEQREDLPALDAQVDPLDRVHVAVGLGQAAHLDRGAVMPSRLSHGTHTRAGSRPLARAEGHTPGARRAARLAFRSSAMASSMPRASTSRSGLAAKSPVIPNVTRSQ